MPLASPSPNLYYFTIPGGGSACAQEDVGGGHERRRPQHGQDEDWKRPRPEAGVRRPALKRKGGPGADAAHAGTSLCVPGAGNSRGSSKASPRGAGGGRRLPTPLMSHHAHTRYHVDQDTFCITMVLTRFSPLDNTARPKKSDRLSPLRTAAPRWKARSRGGHTTDK